jgi:hypothetical protein
VIDVLAVFALVVIAVLLAAVVAVVVGLGSLPGAIARKRGHPQAAAVNAASWLGVGGTVAIYTDEGKPVHIISKVAIRMKKWLSYVIPSS